MSRVTARKIETQRDHRGLRERIIKGDTWSERPREPKERPDTQREAHNTERTREGEEQIEIVHEVLGNSELLGKLVRRAILEDVLDLAAGIWCSLTLGHLLLACLVGLLEVALHLHSS